ncbi:MAG: response regulator [Aphanocapsa sp. GSE-SYN-MK-11-07L]|jgi:signal transduction histidine kinase/DNA-binding response OmpR family regulator|nr:response regulator [Aphanocapsa sp. GSE-SYN-MK-11-07L]
MKLWYQPLTDKIASIFLLLSLLAVAVVGGVTFISAREALKQAAFDRLEVTASLKEEEISRWFEEQERDFLLITRSPDVQRSLVILLNPAETRSEHPATETILFDYWQRAVNLKPSLREVFLINRSNRVLLSTNKERVGEYEIMANVTYFEQVQPGEFFTPIFYLSADTGKPAVTLATPIRNPAGVRQGVVLAHVNLDRIDQIVRERSGLGKSGETYLVGSLTNKNTFISKQRSDQQDPATGLSSQGINAAMSGINGSGLYRNYQGKSVIGVYRWLDGQDVSLIVEMSQAEAFAPARQLAVTVVLVGLISAVLLSVCVHWLSRQLQLSRRQLENSSHQLEQKAQEAEAANRAKSAFLAHMSHELRTPLNAILGFAQVMERDPLLTDQQQESLTIINRSGEHLLGLINDVLEMSKIEAGKIVLRPAIFDLHSLLQTLREMFQIRAEAKKLNLQVNWAADLPQFVISDEGKLRQVLINLLGNAVKFTDVGGVTLAASYQHHHNADYLKFTIADTGCGIALAEQPQLFQPFLQSVIGAGTQEGTGLGLAISRQFVQLMGGEIHFSSQLNQGSTFSFQIKAELADHKPLALPTVGRVLSLAAGQPDYRILVVDDRPENRELLVTLLKTVGFQTQAAADGKAAIAGWQDWQPDLIWMDMLMPELDGYAATRYIKSQPGGQKTVIIALTATAFEEQQSQILAVGCDDFVHKPFREEMIFAKIADHLGVRYVRALPTAAAPHPHLLLTRESLQIMSSDWLARLHQAAIQVDAELITQLLSEVPAQQAQVAEAIAALVADFRFDEIIELTQDYSPS